METVFKIVNKQSLMQTKTLQYKHFNMTISSIPMRNIWDKKNKNAPSKICGRQHLKP